jgi:hypothetical protein
MSHLVIGWINAFSMDELMGLLYLYALVSILTFGYLYQGEKIFFGAGIGETFLSCFGFIIYIQSETFQDLEEISVYCFSVLYTQNYFLKRANGVFYYFFSVYNSIDAVVTILLSY